MRAARWQRWAHIWVVVWPGPLLAALIVASRFSRGALLPAFFVLVLLWPVTLATLRIAGAFAGAMASCLCALLLVAQVVIAAPALPTLPETRIRYFDQPQQAARHTLRLPTGDPAWQRLWSRSPAPAVYLYFLVATKPDVADPGLGVRLGARPIGELSAATRYAELGDENQQHVSWFRIPVTRDELEAEAPLSIIVAPLPAAWAGPGSSGLLGGFSFHPTFPPAPSAFGEGGQWVTDPATVLPPAASAPATRVAPGGPMRYYIELRFVQPKSGRFLAMFY